MQLFGGCLVGSYLQQLEHLHETRVYFIAKGIAGLFGNAVAIGVPGLVHCKHMFDDRQHLLSTQWIADSYSCRNGKGVHRAIRRFKRFAGSVSKNNTRTCWVLKCDIRKFFASIDHKILIIIIERHIGDEKTRNLIAEVVGSFYSTGPGKGLPLGNLTSQLLVNVYMNEFDQFIKRVLKVKHYIRYADDFVIVSTDRARLEELLTQIGTFLQDKLGLQLHPDKVSIETLASGIDFLGWVHFPDHRVLRASTRRRMLRNEGVHQRKEAVLQSYRGLLNHGNAHKLSTKYL